MNCNDNHELYDNTEHNYYGDTGSYMKTIMVILVVMKIENGDNSRNNNDDTDDGSEEQRI